MLEGKEVEGKIGEIGSYSADLSPDGKLKVGVEIEVDLVEQLEKLAAKTKTPIDDKAIAWVKGMLRKPAEG